MRAIRSVPMRYDELMRTILQTQAADWVSIEGIYRDGHHGRAVLRADVDVALVWGRDHNQGESWDHESWSHGFPDRKVSGFYVEVLFRGQIVHADLLLSVDGHRAALPSGSVVGDRESGVVGMRATGEEIALARLVDELHGHSEFDSYLKRANIEVVGAEGGGESGVPRRIR